MNLEIDTTEYGKVRLVLQKKGKKNAKSFAVKPHQSSNILGNLDVFLKNCKIKDPKTEIKKIIIYKGQGSFTGLRVAAAIAQALGLAWHASVKAVFKK